jgi:hypothetical protein
MTVSVLVALEHGRVKDFVFVVVADAVTVTVLVDIRSET